MTHIKEIEDTFKKIVDVHYSGSHEREKYATIDVKKHGNNVVIEFGDVSGIQGSLAVFGDIRDALEGRVLNIEIKEKGAGHLTTITATDTLGTVKNLKAALRDTVIDDQAGLLGYAIDEARGDKSLIKSAIGEARVYVCHYLGKKDGKEAMQKILERIGVTEESKQPSHTVGGVAGSVKEAPAGKRQVV